MIEDNLNCLSKQQVEIFKDCVEEIVPNQLQLKEMEFNGKKLNFVVIYDEKQQLWMLGRPIAEYLEYLNPANILLKLPSLYVRKYNDFEAGEMIPSIRGNHFTYSQNIKSTSVFINQAGLFELMNKSTMPIIYF